MKNFKFIAILLFLVFAVNAANAQIQSNPGSESAQDVAPFTTNSNPGTESAQDVPPAAANFNPGTEEAQDVPPINVNSNPGTEDAQDVPPSVNSNPSNEAAQDVPPSDSNSGSNNTNTVTPVSSGSSSGSRSSSDMRSSGSYSNGCFLVGTMGVNYKNDSVQVTKLQNFLKSTQNADVTVNGIFDSQTEAAVKAFQLKYSDTILAPWGATQPSGIVHITTLKKINQLSCGLPLTLTQAELNILASHRAFNDSEIANDQVQVGSTIGGFTLTNSGSTSVSAELTVVAEDDIDNTAAVGNTSFLGKIWNWVVGFFR